MAELLSKAMAAADDDMKDNSVSPLDLNSIFSKKSVDVLSPEDVAWADSCISDNGMDSLIYALPDTSLSQTIFPAQESYTFPTIEETGISGIGDDATYDVSPPNEQEGNSTHHPINNKDRVSFWSRINEDLGLVEASDSEVDWENLDDYIFKVWELDIPDEEDELVKQLNKALAGSSLDSTLSATENLEVVLDDKLLDAIIAGLDDLSLSHSDN